MASEKYKNCKCECDTGFIICTVNLVIIGLGLISYLYNEIENSETTTYSTTRRPETLTPEPIPHNISGETHNATQSIDLEQLE